MKEFHTCGARLVTELTSGAVRVRPRGSIRSVQRETLHPKRVVIGVEPLRGRRQPLQVIPRQARPVDGVHVPRPECVVVDRRASDQIHYQGDREARTDDLQEQVKRNHETDQKYLII